MIPCNAFRVFDLSPPQMYPSGPGVQVSWPHPLSVTSVEHPENVSSAPLHNGRRCRCLGTNMIVAWEERH